MGVESSSEKQRWPAREDLEAVASGYVDDPALKHNYQHDAVWFAKYALHFLDKKEIEYCPVCTGAKLSEAQTKLVLAETKLREAKAEAKSDVNERR